jgi:hypothetical protein
VNVAELRASPGWLCSWCLVSPGRDVLRRASFIQRVLDDPVWAKRLTAEDRRALSALFWTHINPYGPFRLYMNTRLDLTAP